jgi:hypothetical protein
MWIGAALLCLGLADAGTLRAQAPPPAPQGGPGPGAMVAAPQGYAYPGVGGGFPGAAPGAPVPVGLSGIPGMMPGFTGNPCPPGVQPITLQMDGSPNAFEGDCPCCQQQGLYLSVGGMGMFRQRLTHTEIAQLDPGITLANGTTIFTDTGNIPFFKSPLAVDLHDMPQNANWGVRATIGYRCDDFFSIEFSGYYLLQSDAALTVANPARLDLPFDTFPTPIGFQGDNGLWSQADIVRTSLQTTLASGEANLRYRPTGNRWTGSGIDLLAGVRYFDYFERFGIYTGDDDLTGATFDIFGNPDPRVQALYQVETHNRILAGQLGFDAQFQPLRWIGLGFAAKGAWGVNFLENDVRLIRGDNFVGFDTRTNRQVFSHLYEGNFYFDFAPWQCLHIRGGYNMLWLVDIAEAAKQVDFNLANTLGRQRHDGSVFYHGPTMELQFIF